jgi:hypothetical protein
MEKPELELLQTRHCIQRLAKNLNGQVAVPMTNLDFCNSKGQLVAWIRIDLYWIYIRKLTDI